MDMVYGQATGTTRRALRSGQTMDGPRHNKRRGIRRNVWVNAFVVLFLLMGVLLGITQAFILLAVYALVIAPA